MRKKMRRISAAVLTAGAIAVTCMLFTPSDALGKGKPKPPPCDCPETIPGPFGDCVLIDCGFDCVYACPFPG